jgi:GT2 family glycosyltransferase
VDVSDDVDGAAAALEAGLRGQPGDQPRNRQPGHQPVDDATAALCTRPARRDEREHADMTLLEVVVVTATGYREHLRTCLSSLRAHPLTVGRMQVNVVDNASLDDTEALVRSAFPEVELRALDRNVGFSAANNVVLRESQAPYALVLNPDTELVDDVLDHLVGLMEERPEIGMLGCRLVRRDGTFDHAAKRSFPTPTSALAHFVGVGRRTGASARLAQYRAPDVEELGAGEVDAVNGAFMLVRREAVEEVGLFDEGYWLYMEDLDWCYRFKQQGWKVWYDGSRTVIHVKGGGTKRRGHRALRENYAFHRSMARFYWKFYAGRWPLLDWLIYIAISTKFTASATRSAVARAAGALKDRRQSGRPARLADR